MKQSFTFASSGENETEKLKKAEKTIRWYRVVGWALYALAVASFFGLFTHYDSAEEAEQAAMQQIVSVGLPAVFAIDFKTILLAAAAAWFGYEAYQKGKLLGYAYPKGKRLVVLSILCAVLTFTPVAALSMFKPLFVAYHTPVAYEEIPENTYSVRAFLGSDTSKPSDVDIIWYNDGYDGSAKDVYKKYKICGYIVTNWNWGARDPIFTFGLLDKDGNVVLDRDGQPCTLSCDLSDTHLTPEDCEEFETNVVNAKDLSATPVRYYVYSTQRSIYKNQPEARKYERS